MKNLTRRSVLRSSLGLAAAGTLARPFIANAAATSAEVWFAQGFVPEEDSAFLAMVADYEKASGNKIDQSTIPYAALRQKAVSAITSGAVPDMIEVADFYLGPLQAWDDKLVDLSDIVEPVKAQYVSTALPCCYFYNNTTKKRGYYVLPMKIAAVPFHIWKSLVEKGGAKIADLPNTWDAFLDFFMPVQDGLRKQGMRNIYAYGYQLTANGVDPENTFDAFMIAYGGKDFITPDGKLHTDDPVVKEACVKALVKLTTPFKKGYVPPGVVNWNDADDNNAFHSKQIVMDLDGTISTEVALFADKDAYNDIVTMGLPLSNDGKPVPAQLTVVDWLIPQGAKNVDVAKDFLKYLSQPEVENERLKVGLGRNVPVMPSIVKGDPWWFADPHRKAYTEQAVLGPTLPAYWAYNPAYAEVQNTHVWSAAWADIMRGGLTAEAAADKAYKQIEAIFAKYPIAQS